MLLGKLGKKHVIYKFFCLPRSSNCLHTLEYLQDSVSNFSSFLSFSLSCPDLGL